MKKGVLVKLVLLIAVIGLIASVVLFSASKKSPKDIVNFEASEIDSLDYLYHVKGGLIKFITRTEDIEKVLAAIKSIQITSIYAPKNDMDKLIGGVTTGMVFHLKDGSSYAISLSFIGSYENNVNKVLLSNDTLSYIGQTDQLRTLWDSLNYETFESMDFYPGGVEYFGWQ